MLMHGFAKDLKHAGELAINAGLDMDMQGAVFQNYLKKSVEEGKLSMKTIDAAVRRILTKKYELGLFDDPYRYSDEKREQQVVFSQEMMTHARDAARRSVVLLKNDFVSGSKLLPLSKTTPSIALIGPLGDADRDMLGSWHASGDPSKTVTLFSALKQALPGSKISFAKGCSTSDENRDGFAEALAVANKADIVILAVGENFMQNGEAASRSQLGLPGAQQALLEEIHKTGKPVIAVVMAGRPLVLTWMDENVPAIVNAWHLGTMAGPAIVDVLLGDYNPSGKLTMSFPRNVGQIPIFYSMKNTGRPFNANDKYTSKYLDVPNEPLYPFGYGLSYTNFEYVSVSVDKPVISMGEKIEIEVLVANTGDRAGEETVQLYVRDLVGSVTRPVKELKGFQKITLQPGEIRKVTFTLSSDDLRFYTQDMTYKAEPGEFRVLVGGNSADVMETGFELKE
jgi:beta-glucosidase